MDRTETRKDRVIQAMLSLNKRRFRDELVELQGGLEDLVDGGGFTGEC
jgi:hypothetical protein